MIGSSVETLGGTTVHFAPGEPQARLSPSGAEVCTPGDPGYDEARTLWNAMFDPRPGLVVRCRDTAQLQAAMRFARAHDLLVSVRGGGHNIAGHAARDGTLQIDLSPMRRVRVDPEARVAVVEAGARLADVDEATAPHGLALPTGINSTTGIAGLTLGGGYGWLSRRFGLTVDSLLGVEAVTVYGERVVADHEHEPELFWALRGGGGNFAVVSRFTFRLHSVGPQVISGLLVHPLDDAPELLRAFRGLAREMPDELTVWTVLRCAPPLPFLPEAWHGREVLVFACCWCGDHAAADAALAPLRGLGRPIADVVGPHAFVDWQKAFDPLLEPGARNYWKSHNFTGLDDGLIDLLVEGARTLPHPESEIFLAQLGGAVARIDRDATAFAQRDAAFLVNVHGRWRDPEDDARVIAWARELFERARPWATGGVYANFVPADEPERATAAYGSSYGRLSALKARWDPQNRLRFNLNVRPAA